MNSKCLRSCASVSRTFTLYTDSVMFLKRFVPLFIFLGLLSFSLESQILEPVKWKFSIQDLGNDSYDVVFHADIEEKWHVYSLHLEADKIGPIATSILFEDSKSFKKSGQVKEGKAIQAYDPNFEMELAYFEHSVDFKQRITSSSSNPFHVAGVLEYMACDEAKCIFPDPIDFDITVTPAAKKEESTPKPTEAQKTNGVQVTSQIAEANTSSTETAQAVDQGILEPASWTYTSKAVDGEKDTYDLIFKAKLDPHWHLYALRFEEEKIGPIPTSFTFEENDSFSLIDSVSEGKPKTSYDSNFMMDLSYYEDSASFVQRVKISGTGDVKVNGYLTFMVCDDSKCLPPEDIEFEFQFEGPELEESPVLNEHESKGKGMWKIFFLAFLSGFAALLTPCVFPMIPLTVSFFTKQSKTRAKGISNAILYGVCIIVLYVALGVGVSSVFGADVMNNMATNTYFNLFFFVLLIVFAASFLGAFEITLPASWVNKADDAANKGGFLGIFFMAFTLALVSFSCTGPIVGTLLVEAASGGYMGPIIGMLGFSLAIALPFALFAAFPGWMNSLPQSGGWLNSVKVVLGFLELALAFKFLSNADLVEQWHFLEREVFIAIWIIIFALLTLYLLGKLKLSHDSPLPHISVTRLFMAIITGMFTVYMIPGLWGAPLKLINAFPPPMFYSESPEGVGFMGGGPGLASADNGVHTEGTHKGPQGIYVFHDYEEGLAHAKKVGLPVMLDFTGWACVNCRKMEENVWSDPEIKRILTEDLVLISLYVDERIELPEDKKYEKIVNGKNRKIKYVGDQWKILQEERYKVNSQPYYVLIDHKENSLIEAANYQDHGSIPVFKEWLERGLSKL
jgi:thiol:disulfide interchange protein